MVNAAWPAANETASAHTRPAKPRRAATPTAPPRASDPSTSRADDDPTAVPASALTVERPVPNAFDRSTESVPSTTQKPC